MPPRSRRQHLVSKFYLKGFANSDGRLFRTPLSGQAHPVSLNDATVVNDYYSVDFGEGLSDLFERAFGDIEKPAAVAWAQMTAGRIPEPDGRVAAASWIALQYLRSDALRSIATETRAGLIRLVVSINGKSGLRRHIEKAEGSPISDRRLDAEWKDIIKPGGPTLEHDVIGHMRHVLDLLPDATAMILSSPWMMLVGGQTLVTCDHPVYLIRDPDGPDWGGVGLATAGGIGLSVSRRVGLIVLTKQLAGDHDGVATGSHETGMLLNRDIVSNTRRALYHHPSDKPREWFGGTLPEPRDREMAPIGDSLISEDGWTANGSREDASAPQSPVSGADNDGATLSDLEWPIEGRVFDYHEA